MNRVYFTCLSERNCLSPGERSVAAGRSEWRSLHGQAAVRMTAGWSEWNHLHSQTVLRTCCVEDFRTMQRCAPHSYIQVMILMS